MGRTPPPAPARAALRRSLPDPLEPIPDAAPEAPGDEGFIEELVELAGAVPEEDRQFLLDLARKLARPTR